MPKEEIFQALAAKVLKSQVTDALIHAKSEAAEGTWGANNWANHQETILENVTKALAIDDDNTTPNNELVPINFSGKAIGEPL